MSMYTYKHCLFCYKEDPAPIVAPAKKDICRRFCILASRYLGLDPVHVGSNKTMLSKLAYTTTVICEECVEPATSFCDQYEKVELFKIQMNWRIHEICTIIREADREGSESAPHKMALKEKKEEVGEGMEAIKEFRDDFLELAAEKLNHSVPRVMANKLPGPTVNADVEPQVLPEADPTEESETEPETDSESTSDCSLRDDDSCFTAVVVTKKTAPNFRPQLSRGPPLPTNGESSRPVPKPRLLDLLDQQLETDVSANEDDMDSTTNYDSDASSVTNDEELSQIQIQPTSVPEEEPVAETISTPAAIETQSGNAEQDENNLPIRRGNRKRQIPARLFDSPPVKKRVRTLEQLNVPPNPEQENNQVPNETSGPSKRFGIRIKVIPPNQKLNEVRPPVRRSLRNNVQASSPPSASAVPKFYFCLFCNAKIKLFSNFQRHLKTPTKLCLGNRPIGFNWQTVDIEACRKTSN